MLSTLIKKHENAIKKICDSNHVKTLHFFGSILDASKFNEKSDVDILVEFDEVNITLEEYTN